MRNESDIQRRLDTIEANLIELRTAVQALLNAQRPSTAAQAGTPATAGDWIAGELRDLVASPAGDASQDVVGHAMSEGDDPHNSFTWCYSRFVCTTIGGSYFC